MPIDSQERYDKAIDGLKELDKAIRGVEKANAAVADCVGKLKNVTGASGTDVLKIKEEVVSMLGQVAIYGLPEKR